MNGIMMQRRRLMVAPSVPVSLSSSIGVVKFESAGMQQVAPRITLKSVQSGSGTPRPANVWQLGQTGLAIERAGSNLARINSWNYPEQPTTPTVAQDLPDGAQITASCQVESVTGGKVGIGIRYTKNGQTYSRPGNLVSTPGRSTVSTTIDRGATSIEAYITQAAEVTAYSIGRIQVGLSVSDYQPFRGRQTVAVDFGQEVGAGTFDAGTGILTMTHGIFDASSATIGGTVSLAEFTPFPAMASGAWVNNSDTHCSVLPKVASAQRMGAMFADGKVYLCNLKNTYTNLKTLDAIRAWVAEVGLKVAYPLAEPLTIQLDPAAVMAMPGFNNIWTDGAFRGTYSRSMNVTYRRYAWEV